MLSVSPGHEGVTGLQLLLRGPREPPGEVSPHILPRPGSPEGRTRTASLALGAQDHPAGPTLFLAPHQGTAMPSHPVPPPSADPAPKLLRVAQWGSPELGKWGSPSLHPDPPGQRAFSSQVVRDLAPPPGT